MAFACHTVKTEAQIADASRKKMEETARMIEELAAIPAQISGLKEAAEASRTRITGARATTGTAIAEIEKKRGLSAKALGPTWLPPEDEQRLGQLRADLSRLDAESKAIDPRLKDSVEVAENGRARLEHQLRPRLTSYLSQKQVTDEAALQSVLADAREAAAGPAFLDATTQTLWDSVAAAQAVVRFDAQQIAHAEQRELEDAIGPLQAAHYQCVQVRSEGGDQWRCQCTPCGSNRRRTHGDSYYGPCNYRNNPAHTKTRDDAVERALLTVKRARWKLDEKVALDEHALSLLQASHAEQLAALQRAWSEARAVAAAEASAAAAAAAAEERAAAAAAAAPLRHAAAATVAEAAAALRSASAACTGALEACSSEADSYAPAVARARAKLEAVERQRDAALAARQRVEQGMAAVTDALAKAGGVAREVGALVDERDAARSDAAALRAELRREREEHAAKLAAMRRELAEQAEAMQCEAEARTATLAAEKARADGLEALFRGEGEAQRAALAVLTHEELAALSPHLIRALDVAAKETAARSAAERVAAVAAERAAAEKATAEAAAATARVAACVVCMDSPRTTVLLPCGHKCVCEACASGIVKGVVAPAPQGTCPICRTKITGTVVPFE